MILFTSDTHFGDSRVLKIDRRPFQDLAEHDEALIENWNAVVTQDDELWHLGDVMAPKAADCSTLLSRLNGKKHLVIGNNDTPGVIQCDAWASVQHYKELVIGEQLFVLCHYAFRTWNKMGKKSINLHGHSHGRLKPLPRQFDVGVDAFHLRPVTALEILASRKRGGSP
ncbi:metallophosphoesterase family protein [Oryzifoliimicrobium ureilyticus]|uniref:metallophosphoesterase family protein n=1 Tax=Oryzifoliimicrobium ureilyticus TaxID=3113724 RepID=UPI00307681E5